MADAGPVAAGPRLRPQPRPRLSWRHLSWRLLAWPAVLVVVALALAVGAGAFKDGKGAPESLYQETLQVAGQYRCPVCADESAAVSDAPAAVQIRDQIRTWLSSGWDQQRIRAALVHDYGVSILERPPASGAGALVWVLPAAAAVAALAGLGFAFARWRPGAVLALDRQGPGIDGARPEEDQGIVLADGFAPVEGDEVQDADGRAPSGPWREGDDRELRPPSRRARWGQRALLMAGSGLVLLAGALWAFDRTAAPRPSGQTTSAGSTSITAELEAAASLAQKDPVSALVLYQQVLSTDPGQPVALASEGWIYAQGGYVKTGLALLKRAEGADPSYAPPHLYRGLVLLNQAAQPAAAASELNWYLHHGPAGPEVKVARSALARAEALLKTKGS